MITKQELVEVIWGQAGCSLSTAERVFDALVDKIRDGAANGGVRIKGFVTITAKERPARQARNPRTGELVTVPAKRVAHFKPSKQFNAALNG